MPVFAIAYTYDNDRTADLDTTRPAHREFLATLTNLLASGPYADEPAGALLIAEGPDAASIAADFDIDPFLTEGLITHREIREWKQVKGPWA